MGTSVKHLINVLEVLGYKLDEGGDHVRYELKVNGTIVARTKFSRSWRKNQQIDDSILSLQAKQMHCPVQMLKGLLRESLRKKDYFKELLDRGFITQDDYDFLLR